MQRLPNPIPHPPSRATSGPVHPYASPRHSGRGRRVLSGLLAAIRGRVWIVARIEGAGIKYLLGCYATEAQAVARCRTPFDLIGPLSIGESLPEEPKDWPGRRYPLAIQAAETEALRVLQQARHMARASGPEGIAAAERATEEAQAEEDRLDPPSGFHP